MRRGARAAAAMLAVLAALPAGCRARSDGARRKRAAAPGREAAAPATGTAAPAPPRAAACEVCGGAGLCPRCGDERTCLLCDGDGRCALCGGGGSFRGRTCPACNGNGVCPECRGDGRVSGAGDHPRGDGRLPGMCPLCLEGCGLCPECGGAGVLPDGRPCALCDGGRWCPECRGSGRDPFCAGTGSCPACGGSGSRDPGAPPPPFLLHFRAGGAVRGRLLSPPDDAVTIEYVKDGKPVREAILERRIRPLDYVLALRRFLSRDDVAGRERIAEYVLRRDDALLFLGETALREAKRLEPGAGRIDDALFLLARRRAARFAAAAEAALREEDPRRAWTLASLALSLDRSASRRAAVERLRERARALVAEADAGLSPELRARKRKARHQSLVRAVERAEGWRARAERILAAPFPSLPDLQRAERAAFEAWAGARRAANRAPDDADRAAARAESRADRGVRVLAVTTLARRFLAAGRLELARAAAARALALDPESETARKVNAVVAEAQARRAAGGERR